MIQFFSFCYPFFLVIGLFLGISWILSLFDLMFVIYQTKDLKSTVSYFMVISFYWFICVFCLMYFVVYYDIHWLSFAVGSLVWVIAIVMVISKVKGEI